MTDLHVNVPQVEFKFLREPSVGGEASKHVASRVMRIRELQILRQRGCNAGPDNASVELHCTIADMGGQKQIEPAHHEALALRSLDRQRAA